MAARPGICGVGADALRTQLAACVLDACWIALILGSVVRASVAGAFSARRRAMRLRCAAIARVHDHWA